MELGVETKKDFIVMRLDGNNAIVCCPCGSITLAKPLAMDYKKGTACTNLECSRRYGVEAEPVKRVVMLRSEG